ncbi:MAG: hypothetical protein EA397_15435 [Deltaproteobacteria bacterium]|nr:MAG: hypothetical protein EA397_15435 [Deltaproteobacteria bacterium]
MTRSHRRVPITHSEILRSSALDALENTSRLLTAHHAVHRDVGILDVQRDQLTTRNDRALHGTTSETTEGSIGCSHIQVAGSPAASAPFLGAYRPKVTRRGAHRSRGRCGLDFVWLCVDFGIEDDHGARDQGSAQGRHSTPSCSSRRAADADIAELRGRPNALDPPRSSPLHDERALRARHHIARGDFPRTDPTRQTRSGGCPRRRGFFGRALGRGPRDRLEGGELAGSCGRRGPSTTRATPTRRGLFDREVAGAPRAAHCDPGTIDFERDPVPLGCTEQRRRAGASVLRLGDLVWRGHRGRPTDRIGAQLSWLRRPCPLGSSEGR